MSQDRPHASGKIAPGDTSERVGIESIHERGIDGCELLEKLVDACAAEFVTYYYTNLRMHLAGEEDYKEIAEDARLQDRACCPSPKLPEEPTATNILEELLEAERCAIRTWSEVAGMTHGKDLRTYDMASRILNEEVDHEAWFVELLSKERDGEVNPAGHFIRGEPGDAPYSTITASTTQRKTASGTRRPYACETRDGNERRRGARPETATIAVEV